MHSARIEPLLEPDRELGSEEPEQAAHAEAAEQEAASEQEAKREEAAEAQQQGEEEEAA